MRNILAFGETLLDSHVTIFLQDGKYFEQVGDKELGEISEKLAFDLAHEIEEMAIHKAEYEASF